MVTDYSHSLIRSHNLSNHLRVLRPQLPLILNTFTLYITVSILTLTITVTLTVTVTVTVTKTITVTSTGHPT
jgi:hypothetical protein